MRNVVPLVDCPHLSGGWLAASQSDSRLGMRPPCCACYLDRRPDFGDNPDIMFTLFLLLLSPPTSPSPRVEDPRAIANRLLAEANAQLLKQFRESDEAMMRRFGVEKEPKKEPAKK